MLFQGTMENNAAQAVLELKCLLIYRSADSFYCVNNYCRSKKQNNNELILNTYCWYNFGKMRRLFEKLGWEAPIDLYELVL